MVRAQKTTVCKSPYNGAITQEQFLFYEMRITAEQLLKHGNEESAIQHIVSNNLYQYPTGRSLRKIALSCIKRLRVLANENLLQHIVHGSADEAKQICLYAMMKQNRLVHDFMLSIIGEKYRTFDTKFDKVDLSAFILRLQEQDAKVAGWSVSSITKIKQVLKKMLVDNGYLAHARATTLQPVLLSAVLENAIRANGEEYLLPAFNQFM